MISRTGRERSSTGLCSDSTGGSIIVNLGRTEGELPHREQIPRETYKQGDRIRAYILDIKQFSRGPQIILSRTHPNLVASLFENEVPEISEGIVQIMQVAREPGGRSKNCRHIKRFGCGSGWCLRGHEGFAESRLWSRNCAVKK